jgi:hypothetical protein
MTEQLSKTPRLITRDLSQEFLISLGKHPIWWQLDLFLYKKIKTTFFQIASDGVANVQFLSQKMSNEISLSRTFDLNPSVAPLRTGHKYSDVCANKNMQCFVLGKGVCDCCGVRARYLLG